LKSKLGVLCNEDRGISVDSSPMVTILRQHVKRPENYSAKPSIIDRSDLHPQHGGDARSVGGGSGGGGLSSVCRANSGGGGGAAVAAVEASAAAHRK
jgi:hypothetical protein